MLEILELKKSHIHLARRLKQSGLNTQKMLRNIVEKANNMVCFFGITFNWDNDYNNGNVLLSQGILSTTFLGKERV